MPHLLEESYEVLDALRGLDAADAGGGAPDPATAAQVGHLQEELGDLLFQIVFHARLAQEAGRFSLADVARGVHDKLVHRHPHVFGDTHADTPQQVVANWEEIKKEEKGRSSVTEGIPVDLPALLLSTKLQRKALSVRMSDPGLDADGSGLLERVATLEELSGRREPDDDDVVEHVVGEVLFEMASLSRRLGIDPEQALRTRALAFRDTVRAREEEASGVRLPDAGTH
jgi:tetrapyrrole methylase family protein/MazG family protein